MTEKQFTFDNESLLKDGEFWLDGSIATICNAEEIVGVLNELHEDLKLELKVSKVLRCVVTELEDDYVYLEKKYKELARDYSEEEEAKIMWHSLYEKSQEECKKLEKELHLAHMRAMFSTVKSFKGDVSKRYYYSEETDRVYDTANHYGQYDKILDKKEIAMLLNEYETMLNGELE